MRADDRQGLIRDAAISVAAIVILMLAARGAHAATDHEGDARRQASVEAAASPLVR